MRGERGNAMDNITPEAELHRSVPTPNSRRTSQLLREFLAGETGPRITLGALRDALGDRGFGVLLFIFALGNLVTVNIPLLWAVLGLPLVLLAAQLSYGRHKPWFPDWLTDQTFSRQGFAAVVTRALPYLERAERLIGIAILILALVLALPIPFANWLPACAIAIIALAIVEKDGVAVLIGLVVGVLGLVVAATVVSGLVKAFLLLFSRVVG